MVHLPVMAAEALAMLSPVPDGIYVDATVGLGGHAEEILKALGRNGRLIGIDRDERALSMAGNRLNDTRVVLKKGSFSDIKGLVRGIGAENVDGVLFDFGVSMMQFKDLDRGFSFNSDASLDMRMDTAHGLKAEDIVNTSTENELEWILREYGEEYFARRIARAIAAYRMKKEIATCRELAGIVSSVYKGRMRHHPATKTFQALRIAVNDEVNEIHRGLEGSMDILRKGGRLCAISYHSLEDRIVKNFIRDAGREGLLRVITKKPLTPSQNEIRTNPSSRSAKLRGAERI